jgi:hypothetical protein
MMLQRCSQTMPTRHWGAEAMPVEAVLQEVSGEQVVVGSREQLLHLLAEAAEIEHTLMCSYLYAAFSLKRAGEPGVSAAQGEMLERWRKAIMDVAVEEMGHLIIVANLTVAVGGRPHFGRPNFPVAPGYFPSGVAVRLTGFNAETLKHFIFLERPQDVEGEDGEAFTQARYAREQAHLGLMPNAQDYATIGQLYEAIRTNLVALVRELGENDLFLGDATSQVGPSVVDLEGVELITDLPGAQRAIDIIVEQGEGSAADREVSHYQSFLAIERELSAALVSDPEFAPACRSPTTRCCARPLSLRARSSLMTRKRQRCSTYLARPTACCCGASSSASVAMVPMQKCRRRP